MTVVGARPQFVKASVVSEAFARAAVDEVLVHTGQHFDADMSEVFFDELGMRPPAVNLGIEGGSHGRSTGRMLEALEEQVLERRPDVVLVYGDTNSTMAAALAAVKLHTPVAHVEAGLRSFNRAMPEEINRLVTDHVADLLLTPTAAATANLVGEGIDAARIAQVGDVMYDVALRFRELAASDDVVAALSLTAGGYVLATVHRAENTDDPDRLRAVVEGLARVATRTPVVLPLHPRTREALSRSSIDAGAVRVIDPVGYLAMAKLESCAALVCTDSGGVQKEAFFHRVPCVTLRDETEWVELVESGWNRLVAPSSVDAVERGVRAAMQAGPGDAVEPYGDGRAADRVVAELARRFGG